MLRSELWPEPTAHREYWERHHNYLIYEYDPADDGPETEIIPRIIKAYPLLNPAIVAGWNALLNPERKA